MNLVDKMRCAIDVYIALLPETGHGNIDDSRLMEIAYVAYTEQCSVDEGYLKDKLKNKFACSDEYAKSLCEEACKTIEAMRYDVMLLDRNKHLK